MSQAKMPEPVAWITNESLYGLKTGRTNSKGAVPVHASRSYVAKTPLITTTQAEAYKDACVREALQWQPIETAPKDGTTILVWFRQHGAMTVCWGDRDYNHTSEYAIWLVDDHKHGPYPVRGYSRGDDTHWMPLPPPPTE